jgi:leucyl aminopeptidase
MVSTQDFPVISVTTINPSSVQTDLLVVPVFEGDTLPELTGLHEAAGRMIEQVMAGGEFKAKLFDLFITPLSGWGAPRVALIGAGAKSAFTSERLRRVATTAGLAAKQRRVRRLAFVLRGGNIPASAIQASAEGLMLAAFNADRHKTTERTGPPAEEMIIVAPGADAVSSNAAVRRGWILGDCCNIARDMANEPSNLLTPRVFADRAAEIGHAAGLGVEILDEKKIEKLKMGLLMGVAKGSSEPPRLIVLKHEPADAPSSPVLGLVGKGITFDTGGISIKPAEGMERMKTDMSGGAAVIAAMRAIAMLNAPIKVIGVIPATENMPGGRAVKPGDVLTGASGKTVEVINTDAEGRLVLGDGLWYARQLGATHLVDVATLTGACIVALGKIASGLFGQPTSWSQVVERTAASAGDRVWPMPLYEEYIEQLRSDVADMTNTGGRPAGACTAAMFIKEFAGDLPWAHLDIAGTAWAEDSKPWQAKGPTGVAVRTLAELAFTSSEW